MSIAAHAIGEAPIGAQPAATATSKKPPKPRQAIARPDADVLPEAR